MYVNKDLPSYIVINDDNQGINERQVLKQKAAPVSFPLSAEDLEVIKVLEAKFDSEKNCAGLSAPQIGFGKAVMVFAVSGDEELKKWRPDLIDTMPKTIWINPQYEPMGKETHTDFEACFSVKDLAGPVERFKHIKYTAWLPNGEKVEGEATGFLARVIQHETDHLSGILYIDKVAPGQLMNITGYRKKRAEAMKTSEECLVEDKTASDNYEDMSA